MIKKKPQSSTHIPKHIIVVLMLVHLGTSWLSNLSATTLTTTLTSQPCEESSKISPASPLEAKNFLTDSQVIAGKRDIAWVWLGSPSKRYPHKALGSEIHATTLHVLTGNSPSEELIYSLPQNKVFEDRTPRLFDLDDDGRDEIVLVEADSLLGAAVTVLGLRNGKITELARGPYVGATFRWINPVGVADFDGDGSLDVAGVTTPHISGVLTLSHFRPPHLVPYAQVRDVSNHRFGQIEQQLASVFYISGQNPVIIIPDFQLMKLKALNLDKSGKWVELAQSTTLRSRVKRLTAAQDEGCLTLEDNSTWNVKLNH
jgi:hypothetical protein